MDLVNTLFSSPIIQITLILVAVSMILNTVILIVMAIIYSIKNRRSHSIKHRCP